MDKLHQLMKFLNELATILPMSFILTAVAVLVIIFLIFSYFTGLLVGSRKYRFYHRKDRELVLAVTYFLAGILPVTRKIYQGLKNTEVEIYTESDDLTRYDLARLYLHLHSGKKILLNKLLVSPYPNDIKQISDKIQEVIDDDSNQGNSNNQDELLVDNCRGQSFMLTLFAYVLVLPWLYTAVFGTAFVVVKNSETVRNQLTTIVGEHQGIENTETGQDLHTKTVEVNVYTESDLPAYIPQIVNSVITKINFRNDNNSWEVWQNVQGGNFNTMAEIETYLRKEFQAKGWYCTQTRAFNHHDSNGKEIPNSGVIFYIRDYQQKIEGNVIITKTTTTEQTTYFSVIFSVPVKTM